MADRMTSQMPVTHPNPFERMALVEMNGGGVEHFLAANFLAEIADGFDWADAHPAVESALKAFTAR